MPGFVFGFRFPSIYYQIELFLDDLPLLAFCVYLFIVYPTDTLLLAKSLQAEWKSTQLIFSLEFSFEIFSSISTINGTITKDVWLLLSLSIKVGWPMCCIFLFNLIRQCSHLISNDNDQKRNCLVCSIESTSYFKSVNSVCVENVRSVTNRLALCCLNISQPLLFIFEFDNKRHPPKYILTLTFT